MSYSLPPRTTIAGIISAILGIKRDKYYEIFDSGKCDIAVRIINPVKKGRFNTNLINTKLSPFRIKDIPSARTQISFEVLKDPKYRIYFRHENKEIYKNLFEHLKNKTSIYNVTLGLANCLANFELVAKSEVEQSELIEVDSVVPAEKVSEILEYGEIFKTMLPADFNKDRIAKYREYLFERNGGKIKLKVNGFIVNETQEKIVFL